MGTTMMMMMMILSCTSRDMRNENGCGLLDEAREDVYVENIEAHYEDIESLNKLDVTLTLSETCKELRITKCI